MPKTCASLELDMFGCQSLAITMRWATQMLSRGNGRSLRGTLGRRSLERKWAGVLGWVASPNGGINSLVLASGCCPVRFDLDHSLFSGLESKAADRSVRSTQTNPPGAPPIHNRSWGECLDTSLAVSDA